MKKSHLFAYSLILSIPLWWGVNVFGIGMDNYFADREIIKNPYILKAQVSSAFALPKAPEKIEINARAALSVLIKPNGEKEIIFSKNPDEKLAIASLTKLMSAYVALNYLDLSKNIEVSYSSTLIKGDKSGFSAGQSFAAKDLLYSSMVESSNVGITALTQPLGQSAFVDLMNLEAKNMGLDNMKFFNPTGLDDEKNNNYSTARDLEKLAEKVFSNPSISEILSLREFDLYLSDGTLHHKSLTTNAILTSSELPGLKIIGGKTGETLLAKGCLLLVTQNQKNEIIINVILGSDDRFGEMEKLALWANSIANYRRILDLLN
ncbi:MAG: serine hydrolase [Candidatus Nealsonbacteria bacterium]|nr:serine hydrolase [Candidatus Nealsonbacteria bacterium]